LKAAAGRADREGMTSGDPARAPAAKRLVAVMFTDLVGYSALSHRDEAHALRLLEDHKAILREAFGRWYGKEIKCTGDGFFAEFQSVSACVRCAIDIQSILHARNQREPEDRRFRVRIGIHVGDLFQTDASDWHGDSVNVAARLQTVANPGDVVVSETIVQMARGEKALEFELIGRRTLKHIATPVQAYRVRLPMDPRPGGIRALRALRRAAAQLAWPGRGSMPGLAANASTAAIALTVCGLLAVGSFQVFRGLRAYYDNRLAGPSLPAGAIPLSGGWEYLAPGGDPAAADAAWKPFDESDTSRYADLLHGRYWLRKRFGGAPAPRYPAMVLGMFQDRHRVYLNGKFIGGAGYLKPVAFYAFDPGLLIADGENEVLVQAFSPEKGFMPGLTVRLNLAPAIAELETVEAAANLEKLIFFHLRNLYLFPALILAAVGFAYFLRVRREALFFYFPLYLLASSLLLFYYNPVVTNLLSQSFLRFIKLYATVATSFLLVSAYLRGAGHRRLELLNNSAAVLAFGAAYVLHRSAPSFEALMRLHEGAFLLIALYSAATALAMLRDAIRRRAWNGFDACIVALSLLPPAVILSSAAPKVGSFWFPKPVQFLLNDLGIGYPYLFALVIFAAAAADYLRKTRLARQSLVREQLLLSTAAIMETALPVPARLREVQILLCGHLLARRSSLYVVDDPENPASFRLLACFAEASVEPAISREVPVGEGILGYVFRSRSPVMTSDIRRDSRFADSFSRVGPARAYRDGFCMILPLVASGRVLGMVTVSEHVRGSGFTREDFSLAQLLAHDLGALVARIPPSGRRLDAA
jgi:class 3 adenylate cyclase